MAMLQRRFASSIYAVRRSLERMKEKREHILEDPEKYRQAQIARRLPEDFEELPEEEPVSYTHLDVYKRQIRAMGFRPFRRASSRLA